MSEEIRKCGYTPIGDYAVIGDCHSSALVARNASIDFCCLPHFNSDAIFCRLLDKDKGGFFQIELEGSGVKTTNRQYIENTNILTTQIASSEGSIEITDLMPVRKVPIDEKGKDIDAPHRIIRRIRNLTGSVRLLLTLKPTPNFAKDPVEVTVVEGKGAIIRCPSDCFSLYWEGSLEWDGVVLKGSTNLARNQLTDCALTHCRSLEDARNTLDFDTVDKQIEETTDYWLDWSATCIYKGRYRNEVLRSALVLKLMTYEPSGAIIASPTTSLPEEIGGSRNWDYRYAWMRDGAFTLLAFIRLGYRGEAGDFMNFIERRCSIHSEGQRPFQVMYGIDGELDLDEENLDHLEGYCGSKPVRVGNNAYLQRQLDIYGEVMDCIYLYYHHDGLGLETPEMKPDFWIIVKETVDYVARHWEEPDSGIWEVRSAPAQFTYSKVMCWVALDRGIKLAEEFKEPVDTAQWIAARDRLRDSILANGFSEAAGAFSQTFDSDDLDASILEFPLVGFMDVNDSKMRRSIDVISDRLSKDGMVYRYLSPDGLEGSEATFSMCTFWLISCLALLGRHDEARDRFEKTISLANDVGLYAEELDAANGAQLGNFPQALTHISLINAACDLEATITTDNPKKDSTV